MQAARNFVVNGRYAEARRVLDGMTARNARWYYLSSLANQGMILLNLLCNCCCGGWGFYGPRYGFRG